MKSFVFSLTYPDPELFDLVKKTDKRILAKWAIDCTQRVIHFFEKEYPHDTRPKIALTTLKTWIDTGVFSMTTIRKASLDSHAAARSIEENSPARSSVARAAGQAVATAHVSIHSFACANYCLQAVFRASDMQGKEAIKQERKWQYQQLVKISSKGFID
jgi:hypothetical protein